MKPLPEQPRPAHGAPQTRGREVVDTLLWFVAVLAVLTLVVVGVLGLAGTWG